MTPAIASDGVTWTVSWTVSWTGTLLLVGQALYSGTLLVSRTVSRTGTLLGRTGTLLGRFTRRPLTGPLVLHGQALYSSDGVSWTGTLLVFDWTVFDWTGTLLGQ